jgi:signal transduction histidine kinase/CheY-like chemotaxis protein/predicted hydrocarbon binding protein
MNRLRTVRVPEAIAADFQRAEELVSRYFSQRHDDPSRGTIEISGERYILVRAASLSVEFFALVEKLFGEGREVEARDFARNILFDLAHAIGKSDAKNFHERMGLSDPVARLSAGPVHFSFSGWAFVDIDGSSRPEPGPGFTLLYDHPYSFESDAWIRAERTADVPVCIMNAGYSSGWCEESFDLRLVSSEMLCRAKGDDCCRFIMAPPEHIEERVEQYMRREPGLALKIEGYSIPDFFSRKRVEEDLRAARDELEERVFERTAELRASNEQLVAEMAERARMEDQLRQTQRIESLGRLAGGVAHDFNNLLGVILGYSSMLERRLSETEPAQMMASEITHAAQMAADLTRQLLTFSRGRVVSVRAVDVNRVIRDTALMLDRIVGDDISLDPRLCSEPLVMVGDANGLEQVLINLVVNSRDAMPEGGRILIETSRVMDVSGDPVVLLCISDSGVGMDAETQARLFEPFFTTKAETGGSGLGLSTVHGIVHQAGGSIRVESSVGHGCRFEIRLPLSDDASVREQEAPPPSLHKRSETVLLVEDRVIVRTLVAEMLKDMGCTVLVSDDVDDALRLAEGADEPIDALVCDLVMPKMGGSVVAKRIALAHPDIAVLFMSGFTSDPAKIDQLSVRRIGFIAKPFTPDDLATAFAQLCDGA